METVWVIVPWDMEIGSLVTMHYVFKEREKAEEQLLKDFPQLVEVQRDTDFTCYEWSNEDNYIFYYQVVKRTII